MSTYRPVAVDCDEKVCVPPRLSACATVVKVAREARVRLPSLPTSMATLAPNVGPNWIVTELSETALPMSRISPEPVLRPPNTGLPM